MNYRLTKTAVAATFLAASGAHAFTVTGDVGVSRTVKNLEYQDRNSSKRGLKSIDYSLSTHIQPADELPVSFGIRANLITIDHKEYKSQYSKAKSAYGYEFTPELRAWIPSKRVSPYIKAGFALESLGHYKFEFKSEDNNRTEKETAKTQGLYGGLGAAFIINKNLSGLVDYTYSNTSFKVKSDVYESDKDTMHSHSIMLGARVSV